ncbi:hypothetical protein HMI51_00490 [Corallococcus coralloides]|nr:hypothetical protein [Corallococcus coralloides]
MTDVKSINDAIQREGAHWRAAPNPLTSLPLSQLKLKLGALPGPNQPGFEDAERIARNRYAAWRASMGERGETAGVPVAVDWRNHQGRDYTSPVKDQSFCGSCVAFGTLAALEGTLRIQRDDPYLPILSSEAHLFYVYAQQEGYGCGTGWYIDSAAGHLKDGVTDASLYPYTPGDQPAQLPENWKQGYTLANSKMTLDLDQMKAWLAHEGQLITRFNVYDDFFGYSGGVYSPTSSAQPVGGHCVCVVGYSDTERCWICKNSWGPWWGDKGFFKIAYGVCGIDYSMWLPTDITRPHEQAATLTSRVKLASASHDDGRGRLWAVNERYVWSCAKSTPASDAPWTQWSTYWSQPASTLPGIQAAQVAAAKLPDGHVELFALAADGTIWGLVESTSGGDTPQWNAWQPPIPAPSGVKPVEIAVGAIAGGRLQHWCIGTDGKMYSRFQRDEPSLPWSDWNEFQPIHDVKVAHLTTVPLANGALQLFAIDTNCKLHACRKQSPQPGAKWTPWHDFSGVKDRKLVQLAAARLSDGRPQLFVITHKGELYTCVQKGTAPDSDWSAWTSFSQPTANIEGVAVGVLSDRRLQLWLTSPAGGGLYTLWTCWKQGTPANAPWTGWSKMAFPVSAAAAEREEAVRPEEAGVPPSAYVEERIEAPDDGRIA